MKGGQHIEVNEEFEHSNVEESGSGGRENNAWIHRSSGKYRARRKICHIDVTLTVPVCFIFVSFFFFISLDDIEVNPPL